MNESAAAMVHYIQLSLYNGKQANKEGYYCYLRKEFVKNTWLSSSTVSRNIYDAYLYLRDWCDFSSWAKYEDYAGEKLYVDVSYEQGILKFKRNSLTLLPEFSFLWALPPLGDRFAYDAFDTKHRRRWNGSEMKYDAIPWRWNADEYEEELKQAREAIREHREKNKTENE